jgi:hypothetical protein
MVSVISSPMLKTYTLEEFWKLPEPEDCTKLELIAGVLYMTHHLNIRKTTWSHA